MSDAVEKSRKKLDRVALIVDLENEIKKGNYYFHPKTDDIYKVINVSKVCDNDAEIYSRTVIYKKAFRRPKVIFSRNIIEFNEDVGSHKRFIKMKFIVALSYYISKKLGRTGWDFVTSKKMT